MQGAEIRLRTTVTNVVCRPGDRATVRVDTDTGYSKEFDHVVMTAPLGWLKKNLRAFEPPLPLRLCQAIRSVGYGCLEKVSLVKMRTKD